MSEWGRRTPEGRTPQWLLDERAGRPAVTEPGRAWTPGPPPGRRRRRRDWAGTGAAVATVAVIGLGIASGHLGLALPGTSAASGRSGFPTPGGDSADAPLGTPIAAPTAGSFDFTHRQDDGVTPVAYDPCRPVHYVTRPDNAPVGGDLVVRDAVARISEVTGLQFVDDGVTDEAPSDDRSAFQPDRYGDRWAPVLISWDTVTEQADLAADVAGLGGSSALTVEGDPAVYVTGAVELDAPQFTDILSRPNGIAEARGIVLHELGHVVGLAHVSDPTQLMYPELQPGVLDFAAGDLAGLAQLGSGACVPSI